MVLGVTSESFNRLMVLNALSPLRTLEVLQDLVPGRGTIVGSALSRLHTPRPRGLVIGPSTPRNSFYGARLGANGEGRSRGRS